MIYPKVVLEIWGDFALWTRPETKVERLTYPVPTPGGIRGVLASIYAKPSEFYWQICSIEVLKPIRYITFKRNEVKSKASKISDVNPCKSCICIEDDRTQRQSVVLKDVRYRVTAQIVPRPEFPYPPARLLNQFERRVEKGQCFMQPVLGTREFPAYFEGGSSGIPPIDLDLDLGYMLYDVFDLNEWKVGKTANPSVSLFHAYLEHGVLTVPPYDSPLVKKPGEEGAQC